MDSINEIETIIQYEFNNKNLLLQAFKFNPDYDTNDPNTNEALRIIGKRTINFSLTQILSIQYGFYDKNKQFRVSNGNNNFNDLINNLYSKDIFSRNIDILDLNKYIDSSISLPNDINRRIFEAIIGAITIDSNWNMEIINDCLIYLLDIEYYLNNGFTDLHSHYVLLIHNWAKEQGLIPHYEYSVYTKNNEYIFKCMLHIDGIDAYFDGEGKTKNEAKMMAACKCYDYLMDNDLVSSIRKEGIIPNPEEAMKQLEKLAMKGFFTLPEFIVEEENDYYVCTCMIDECDVAFKCAGDTDVEAINASAYKMLLYILGIEAD